MMPRSLSRLKRWKCVISANISATYSPIGGFTNYNCLIPETVHGATLPVPAEEVEVRDICQHQRHIFPYRRVHQLRLLDTWDCPYCCTLCPGWRGWSARYLPTSAPHIPLLADSPTAIAWYLRLSMMPHSLSRLNRWKCVISANIIATYSPISGFFNYICLIPETVHDAALPVPAEEVEVRDICQHQRHTFPYRQIHQLHLLDTWDCPWCCAPLPITASHIHLSADFLDTWCRAPCPGWRGGSAQYLPTSAPLSAASSTTLACYLRLSMMPHSLSRLKRWKCAISANTRTPSSSSTTYT